MQRVPITHPSPHLNSGPAAPAGVGSRNTAKSVADSTQQQQPTWRQKVAEHLRERHVLPSVSASGIPSVARAARVPLASGVEKVEPIVSVVVPAVLKNLLGAQSPLSAKNSSSSSSPRSPSYAHSQDQDRERKHSDYKETEPPTVRLTRKKSTQPIKSAASLLATLRHRNGSASASPGGSGDAHSPNSDPSSHPNTQFAPIDVETILAVSRTSAQDKMPLELFDDGDLETRTPEQWIALSHNKYDGKGTPAQSLYYLHREWRWTPCKVLSYDESSGKFLIQFDVAANPSQVGSVSKQKYTSRLNILFDDEDKTRFEQRVALCRQRRDELQSWRRYQSLIDLQSESSFTPVHQSTLLGIVKRLMARSPKLLAERERQLQVEQLLVETRDQYSRGSKQAIVEYRRNLSSERKRMEALNLPSMPPPPPVPFLAVKRIPERAMTFAQLMRALRTQHFTSHNRAPEVVLALFRASQKVKDVVLLDVDEQSPTKAGLKLPMSLYEFSDHQDDFFNQQKDRLVMDWRSLVVNKIRDLLSGTFNLFVNDIEDYYGTSLYRFIKMVGLMLRDQLADIIDRSTQQFIAFMLQYVSTQQTTLQRSCARMLQRRQTTIAAPASSQPVSVPRLRPSGQHNTERISANVQEAAPVLDDFATNSAASDDFFNMFNVATLKSLQSSGVPPRPLFVYKMTIDKAQVVFMPPLESMPSSLLDVMDVASKLLSFTEIDSEVCPLLGVTDGPICSEQSAPWVFRHVKAAQCILEEIVAENSAEPRALAALYQEYGQLLAIDCEAYVQAWFKKGEVDSSESPKKPKSHPRKGSTMTVTSETSEAQLSHDENAPEDESEQQDENAKEHTLEETQAEIRRCFTAMTEIENKSPSEVSFRLITVQCQLVKEQLIAKAKELANKLMEGLAVQMRQQCLEIFRGFQNMLTRLKAKPADTHELAKLKELSHATEHTDIPTLQREIFSVQAKMKVLEDYLYPLARPDFNAAWSIVRYPQQLLDALEETKQQIAENHVKYQGQLNTEREVFHKDLMRYRGQVEKFIHYGSGSLAEMEDYASQVEVLREKLNKCEEQVKSFNERDQLFGEEPKEYRELLDLQSDFEPHFSLWSVTSDFHASHSLWMTGPFIELDQAKVADSVESWFRLMFKLEKQLVEKAPEPAKVAEEMRKKIEDFRNNVPIVQWLRSPGLRQRHWQQISSVLGANVTPDHSLTLSQLLLLPVHKHADKLEEICSGADKEYALEQGLDRMLSDWKPIAMEIEEYKETKTFILKRSEEILTLLDDQIMKTQAMRGSPYIKPFEVRCKQWEARLQLISQIMEQWLKCQQTWLYLEPIFSSDDIMRQMPNEARRFALVDAYWRKTMEAARRTPNVLEFVGETESLLKGFEDSNKMLDLIGKGLNDYLETKRLAFPRFYFLSNDELLSILSQTKNALAVQPHLSKCFDAIASLNFTETTVITAMFSVEGEKVNFIENIDPNQGSRKGNVEVWLKDVERVMRTSLEKNMADALHSYPVMPREQWVMGPPGQIVLAVSQVMWTAEVTAALQNNGKRGLEECIKKLNAQLAKLVECVRGDLSSLNRLTLGALTVIDVHARDVVQRLIDAKVEDVSQFEWLSQLRYYWDTVDASDSDPQAGELKVRMVNTSMNYGYEYLGNTSRLVITPLTDRAYATMMGAIQLHLGGAPEGPAGTGKTETVKDLSKALAIQCVVFNCSDGLDYQAMAKFFKGLASSGAWSCFDEFNRIELEVLSVIAQQVSSIQRAAIEGKVSFFFDGVTIPLVHTCTVFITMNPGYAGRAELPDNLKALFRTVAMMVPDYALIAEIVLYSYGYSEARALSRKMVACLRLASEQLSSQEHYDFGMRNLKSILSAAGALKRQQAHLAEDLLCLRAICDCNVPKFVSDDIPLFTGITKDLFPAAQLPEGENVKLIEALKATCTKMTLQATPYFIGKCLELYETIMVRHGLMMVGQTYSGKSTCLRVLETAMISLASQGVKPFDKVKSYFLNPKSVTRDQLYGGFDKNTHEWTDGILPVLVRECVKDTSSMRKWVVFDGPVDAMWIENMNTVLDDNKKLCLASGEIIKLSSTMTMMFEVEDLAMASPATVSRCGMVYMEPRQLGSSAVIRSWLQRLPAALSRHQPGLLSLFEWLIPVCTDFTRKNCISILPVDEVTQVSSLIHLLGTLLDEFRVDVSPEGKENSVSTFVSLEDHAVWIECLFVFAVVWSIGAGTDASGRTKFSAFFHDLVSGKSSDGRAIAVPFPTPGLVYDFVFDKKTCTWQRWLDTIPPYQVPDRSEFHDIIVPTMDTARYSWLLQSFITHGVHCLLTGDTGTGKTIMIQRKLVHELDREVYVPLSISFSARTSANQTQDMIDGKLERRRLGVLGPPLYKKCVIFVDDLNMPLREVHDSQAIGAQPPIELLRQWMDYGGWYDRVTNTFRKIVDVQFVAAMGPPGGGRNSITRRYLRHFNTVCLTPYDEENLKRIFSCISAWWLRKFNADVQSLQRAVVDATVQAYSTIQHELLPTPAKSHYTFNLRDVSKVFQGMMMIHPEAVQQPVDLVRLWSHEVSRVFCDRLVSKQDINWFNSLLIKQVQRHFNIDPQQVMAEKERIIMYCDFTSQNGPKKYQEVKDYGALKSTIERLLEDYNRLNSKATMNLVMFQQAIEHITRISRIIRQPYGNALLVGVGGSGRQSLTRLAAAIAEYDVFQAEISKAYNVPEWREDLRVVMRKAGVAGKPVVFLFSDTHIKHESFVEDINNILNNGEVPHLFPADEMMQIIEELGPIARKFGQGDSNAAIYAHFVSRCRHNIHLVLCFSPIGSAFRNRLRMFPSLVNCTTIDWFHPWSAEALRSVATRFLQAIPLEPQQQVGVVEVCVDMQERVIALSDEFRSSLGRYNYVTPTSYLELIKTFTSLYESKRKEIGSMKQRYETGLFKLDDTATQVKQMQQQLEVLQPQLIKSSAETVELMKTIETRSTEVSQTRLIVEEEEKECNEQAATAEKIKDECTAQLAEAMPALESALESLKVINKNDLVELKTMKVPPAGVVLTMQALCIMMQVEPVKVGQAGKKKDDYWEAAKRTFLRDTKFIETLQEFDKDNIPSEVMVNIHPITKNPEFMPAKVAKASKAAEGFCKWVRSMEVYDKVAKEVQPRRQALQMASESLAAASAQLALKKAQLKEVQDLLDELNAQFDQVNRKKMSLQEQVEECSKRLDRAEKLIGGLSGERNRWMATAQRLGDDFNNVLGNVLVSSGVIAYLGVFTSAFRAKCITSWVELLQQKGLRCDPKFSLCRVLGDPVQVRQWGIQQLPKDDFSIDNAVILHKSTRFSLMIDPQGQANRWVKNMEESRQLKVIKQTDAQFGRLVLNAVQFGTPLLIENIDERVDPLLEPLLLKQFFKQGNRLMVQIGGEVVEFNEGFRLYLTTKLSNPHYPPEVSTKVTLLNFMITPQGLEDQMLGIVVSKEEPELEKERSELIIKSAENQRQLQATEDKILQLLNESKGMILDDEELINFLQKSKVESSTIEKRVAAAAKTEERINKTRSEYQSVAVSAANLFFCISDLAVVDPMYQYSLNWFISLFIRAIEEAPQHKSVAQRTVNIDNTVTYSLYRNVCRSLFERDKLLFSFLLCLRILQAKNQLDAAQLRFLLTGGTTISDNAIPNPTDPDGWLSDSSWAGIQQLAKLERFANFDRVVIDNLPEFRKYYQSTDPFATPIPGPAADWNNRLNMFEKMLVLRCLRPDKLLPAVQLFITHHIGKKFIEPPAFDLEAAFLDSDQCSPLVFILSPGVDPSKEVFKLAEQRGFGNLENISLGQGQGPFAEQAIREAVDKGSWVLLQNCHLALSWLPTLERIVDELSADSTNPNFRLWLTSMPSINFPVSVLQNGVKMTNEPPKGIRANLNQTYRTVDDKMLDSGEQPQQLKRVLFGLAFFHAVVLERRKFGALGWNIRYEFTDSDLSISIKQLQLFLDLYPDVPFKALKYLVGELNYGGRVTDDWDRRTISSILDDFMTDRILEDNYAFDSAGLYIPPSPPANGSVQIYRDYIASLPQNDGPDVFGLHENATITSALKESNLLLSTLLLMQPRAAVPSSSSTRTVLTRDEVLSSVARDIQDKIPANFDIAAASKKFPVVYANSMNTVLVQELIRYNRLLDRVRSSLVELQKAIKGESLMSFELERMADALYDGQVPQLWASVAYPSLKPLGGWIMDLQARLAMFSEWLRKGPPGAYWISGFYFTQSFLTATLQNYARTHRVAIDEIAFDFRVMDDLEIKEEQGGLAEIVPPQDGCYVYGLFMEGARWDTRSHHIIDSAPKQLYSKMPIIWLRPTPIKQIPTNRAQYNCPVYKTSKRQGVLSTTGHSTNFVLSINLPSDKPEKHWVKRGVALLTQLDS